VTLRTLLAAAIVAASALAVPAVAGVSVSVEIGVPLTPPAFFATDLFTWRAKLALLREPFVRRTAANADETVAQFVRRLGPVVHDGHILSRLRQQQGDLPTHPTTAGDDDAHRMECRSGVRGVLCRWQLPIGS